MEDVFKEAVWIWKEDRFIINDYAYFRKEFKVDSEVESAIIHVSAHNHMKVYINGILVSGMVTPIPSVATKTKYYLSYDITKHVNKGMNCLYAEVLFLGGSGQNYVNASAGFILNGVIKLKLSPAIRLNSDCSWLTSKVTAHRSSMPFQQNRKVTPVEQFDQRLYQEQAKLAYFNNENWHEAVESSMNLYAIKMIRQSVFEGSIHESITPLALGIKDGVQVFDTGRIVSGYVHLILKGYHGLKIRVRYSEDLINGRVKHNVANEHSDTYYDDYIMNAETTDNWHANFTYKSFRYFEIENYPDLITEENLNVLFSSTAIKAVGNLSSKSYPILNQLYRNAYNTQLNNTLGMLVDCPHREQAQYLGDSDLQAENLIYNFTNSLELITKVLQDFSDIQLTEGFFPYVAPTNFFESDFHLRICEYDMYYILLMEKAYFISRDKHLIKQFLPTAKHMLAYYLSQIDAMGLVPKGDGWHISDWPYPSVDHNGNYLTFQNMLVLKCLRSMIKLLKCCNESVSYYEKIEVALEHSIKKHLKKDGLFIDCFNSTNKHQGINAFALELDLFNNEETDHVIEYIIGLGFSSGVILNRTILRELLKQGRTEAAIKLMFDYDKGWGNILKFGWETMWEGYDDIESHSHAWNCYPLRMIQEYIVGIQLTDGREQVIINPQFVKRIKDIKASVITSHGTLTFGYEIVNQHIIFKYYIPDGIEGCLVYRNKTYKLDNGKISRISHEYLDI